MQPATSGRAAACAPACLRFLWGLDCMCHTLGISCTWLRGHVLAQGDHQRALPCFLGRLPRGRQHSALPLRASPPSAFQILVQCCPMPTALRAYRKLSWPIRARGAEIGGRVCLGTRVYWYVCKCIGMYHRCIGMYIHVKVCNRTYLYVSVSYTHLTLPTILRV